jgi:transcriptional regulator with XRE-family HTH domain
MNKKEIGMRIKQLHEDRGLHQKEVAAVLGIGPPAYCDLENGHTAFTAVALDKLAEFYGLTLDEFLHADKAVMNMHDHASHGYNVIHTRTVNGLGEDLFKRLCEMIEGNTIMLREITQSQKSIVELMTKLNKQAGPKR